MNLEGEILLGIEQFEEKRKSKRIANLAEDLLAVFEPQFVQRRTAEWPIMVDALRLRPIDDLPGLSDWNRRWQPFPVKRFQAASAPDAFHEDRLEHQRLSQLRFRHEPIQCSGGSVGRMFFPIGRSGLARALFAVNTRSNGDRAPSLQLGSTESRPTGMLRAR